MSTQTRIPAGMIRIIRTSLLKKGLVDSRFIFSFFITATSIYTEVLGFLQAIVGGLSGLQIGMLQCPGK
jgi:hypothetical protein